jgi:hypothetical protein
VSRAPKLTNYVSEIDQFLQEFDKQHPLLTKSQQKEDTKYTRIHRLRDTTEGSTEDSNQLWEGF